MHGFNCDTHTIAQFKATQHLVRLVPLTSSTYPAHAPNHLTRAHTLTTPPADAPGLSADDIRVEVHEGCLTVCGEKKVVKEEGQKGVDRVWRQERSFTRFSRAFALPEDAAAEGVAAQLQHGVLTVDIPKASPPPKSEPKRIKVVAGGEGAAAAPAAPAAAVPAKGH